MTPQQMAQELARLRAENEKLKAHQQAKLTPRVSAKGALSVYGLGRWPVTLYRSQWERLLGFSNEIQQFIADHLDELKDKGDDAGDKAA